MQTLAQVDATRMVLWGTSLSGGHVVCMAARGAPAAVIIAGERDSIVPADLVSCHA